MLSTRVRHFPDFAHLRLRQVVFFFWTVALNSAIFQLKDVLFLAVGSLESADFKEHSCVSQKHSDFLWNVCRGRYSLIVLRQKIMLQRDG
jgi:hypothetical protein